MTIALDPVAEALVFAVDFSRMIRRAHIANTCSRGRQSAFLRSAHRAVRIVPLMSRRFATKKPGSGSDRPPPARCSRTRESRLGRASTGSSALALQPYRACCDERLCDNGRYDDRHGKTREAVLLCRPFARLPNPKSADEYAAERYVGSGRELRFSMDIPLGRRCRAVCDRRGRVRFDNQRIRHAVCGGCY